MLNEILILKASARGLNPLNTIKMDDVGFWKLDLCSLKSSFKLFFILNTFEDIHGDIPFLYTHITRYNINML